MIDFVEYIVSELKNKKLTKDQAASLLRQFKKQSTASVRASAIHPLLHQNTSNFDQQRYRTSFIGDEFYLVDHQVQGQKVLPGVAYLEMIRAAIEDAEPQRLENAVLELRDLVWLQPIVVTNPREVNVALSSLDNGCISFSVSTGDGDQFMLHCEGIAAFVTRTLPVTSNISQLQSTMDGRCYTAQELYPLFEKMGITYGPSHQGIEALALGDQQLLANLQLPKVVGGAVQQYVLHPSMMDSALQACIGLMASDIFPTQPLLPFALDCLRVFGACHESMTAWIRFTQGHQPIDAIVKLDIDLCDAEGNVCVQLLGFTGRFLARTDIHGVANNCMLALPDWKESVATYSVAGDEARTVVLCGFGEAGLGNVQKNLANTNVVYWPAPTGSQSDYYRYWALSCFNEIKSLFAKKTAQKITFQCVFIAETPLPFVIGITGLLKSASLENPKFQFQLLVLDNLGNDQLLIKRLQENHPAMGDDLVRYQANKRYIPEWKFQTLPSQSNSPSYRENGVYLITGGMGGLGQIFARDILSSNLGSKVILSGRGKLSGQHQQHFEALQQNFSGRVEYYQLNLADYSSVQSAINTIMNDHKQLNGVIHSAGMIADNFILKKTSEEFANVLTPKLEGTFHLDQATQNIALDFFVLFSSVSSIFGNLGQTDYATANGFMDYFAADRNQRVQTGRCSGKTLSINWPLWQHGGMTVDRTTLESLQQSTGMTPLTTENGIAAFHYALSLPVGQVVVAQGNIGRLQQLFLPIPVENKVVNSEPSGALVSDTYLLEKAQDYIRRQLASLLKLPAQKIDTKATMERYGIDSVMAMNLTNQLEKTFGSLSKTLFFEYQTLAELSAYFVKHHAEKLKELFAPTAPAAVSSPQQIAVKPVASVPGEVARKRLPASVTKHPYPAAVSRVDEPIAIVGLSGRYPEAVDLESYWQNLSNGRDCIIEVPQSRWDWREYFSEDRNQSGRHFSKWGGFIEGVDEFDPLFFNISPREAELIDPQERLFLQHAWMAIEDAGYTRERLQLTVDENGLPGQAGVYVGVMYSEYQLYGAESSLQGKHMGIAGSFATIANRVSYVLNLHGPSMTVDTMCSSSLTAIHMACQDLKLGRTGLAIAGGVNVSIHPNKYLVLSEGQFLSSEGHCQSFGEGGDGYIPGEGVGAVVLKRLSDARRDGDPIYGVIRGSALNHGGKTNGYSVPNPQAQAHAISRALSESGVNPRHISYLEAHGTGTKLGDPIEMAALSQVFQRHTQDTGFCLVGSAKSNIGHCESAAGIAGLTKILLQMKHRQIVPSLHSASLNPHIDFEHSPFVVNQTLTAWETPDIDGQRIARIAGLSSFGAGGSNAHMIIEEYPDTRAITAPARAPHQEVIIPLSARTPAQLQVKVRELVAYLRGAEAPDLDDIAYTLQVGREAMSSRLGILSDSPRRLIEQLEAWLTGDDSLEGVYQGQVKQDKDGMLLINQDEDMKEAIEKWIVRKKHHKLVELWVQGLDLDWQKMYGQVSPRRISLPTYPFARERYWVDIAGRLGNVQQTGSSVLHPLLHTNTSNLSQQSYRSVFTGEESYLRDHQVALKDGITHKVLPGVAYLEMIRAAVEDAVVDRTESGVLVLQNIAWSQPVVVTGTTPVHLALYADASDVLDFDIYTEQPQGDVVHCQGRALFVSDLAPATLDLTHLQGTITSRVDTAALYHTFERLGLHYGPSHRGIHALYRGEGQVLAELRLPASVAGSGSDYVLHPSVMDSALQASLGLFTDLEQLSQAAIPFSLDTLRLVFGCTSPMWVWLRYAPGSQPGDAVVKLDMDLCDAEGHICVQLRGFASRAIQALPATAPMAVPSREGRVLAVPQWASRPLAEANNSVTYPHYHMLLLGLDKAQVSAVRKALPHSICRDERLDGDLGQQYQQAATACFNDIKALLDNLPQGQVLFQVVASDQGMLAGLSGLLNTAHQENPRVVSQLILIDPALPARVLAEQLPAQAAQPEATVIRLGAGERQVLEWQPVNSLPHAGHSIYKDDGVYLITGGLGGLGRLFARDILTRTGTARVILTGRAAISESIQTTLHNLAGSDVANRLSYQSLDLLDAIQVQTLVDGIVRDYGQLTGIFHSAGMIADNFLLRKSAEEFNQVIAPKVQGTWHLDQASRLLDLDCFVLFSSLASVNGNAGQGDYAAGNGFMDRFAAYRQQQVERGERHGKSLSLNWPLWQDGGMQMSPEQVSWLRETTGMRPLQTVTGLEAFYESVALPYAQVLVMEGELEKIVAAVKGLATVKRADKSSVLTLKQELNPVLDIRELPEQTQEYVKKQLSGLLKLPTHKIDAHAPLEQYGIDSVMVMKLTHQLEQVFGSLSKTLLFEYQTIAELSNYLIREHGNTLNQLFAPGALSVELLVQAPSTNVERIAPMRRIARRQALPRGANSYGEPIAIVGLSGRYPEAVDLESYWQNLSNGRDCIIEVPQSRWDWREYFSEDRNQSGRHFSKWGGFIEGVDEFDPLFFNISPREAELIDPQERLFLQHAWMAIEDAGYTRSRLQLPDQDGLQGQVGVYIGVMYGEYSLSGSLASIANRVSYVLNLHGPSMTVDTMCSSSLTAIHMACQDLKLGRTGLAIAGGVNVSIHPNKYLVLSEGQFLSSEGHCQSFGEGGDGYIPGEGVGAVVLKRLSDARRDGDPIYGVIRGSALNHGGKTNGYSVPNPQAQAHAISRALSESGVNPRHISYLEAHGTGTKLGDPIEMAALSQVFQRHTQDTGFCLVGSAKSNIGHCESAAGIAGLTKILLQMKHRQIVPSLHSASLNPHIDFEHSPFVVNQTLTAWETPDIDGQRIARIAGLSSFGAGGSNAHMIIEEYPDTRAITAPARAPHQEVIIPLSARTPAQLQVKVRELVAYLRGAEAPDLDDIAYTLQVGREAMSSRLGILSDSPRRLIEQLEAWLTGDDSLEGVYQGQVKQDKDGMLLINQDEDMKEAIEKWIVRKKHHKLVELWVQGLDLDWQKMYGQVSPRRISLPTYPFARERYWVDIAGRLGNVQQTGSSVLHPLLHTNTSNLSQQSYRSVFTGEESYLRDHQVALKDGITHKVLPGVAYLEMIRAAVEDAVVDRTESGVLVLQNIAWSQPVVVTGTTPVHLALYADASDVLDFDIYTEQPQGDVVHCQGRALFVSDLAPATLDLTHLQGTITSRVDTAALYHTFERLGLHYGPSHRGIHALYRGEGQVLAELRLPASVAGSGSDYVLHPSVMDSALQASLGLFTDLEQLSQAAIPFSLDTLRLVFGCTSPMWVWLRYAPGSQPGDAVVKLDMDLCDAEGHICVQLRGFASRAIQALPATAPMAVPSREGRVLAVPQWASRPLAEANNSVTYPHYHMLLLGLDKAQVSAVRKALPHSICRDERLDGDLGQQYQQAATACFNDIKALLDNLPQGQVLFQVVASDQGMLAGLSGLLNTAHQENPRVVSQLILIDPALPARVLAEQLPAQAAQPEATVIRLGAGERQVLEWQPVNSLPHAGHSIYKDDGVYLITGGLGGLGRLFARDILTRTGTARVILTGRAAISESIQTTLHNLAGSDVANRLSYQSLDLLDAIQVQTLVDGIVRDYGQLTGIFHSAGMIADNFLLRKSAEEFNQVIAPKVQGTWHLDQASRLLDLDCFVLFSSLASVNGNAGQGDYAAGNGFMDRFAAYRQQQVERGERHGKSLSLNWPLWQDGGMQMSPEQVSWLRETTGMRPLQTVTGLEAFYESVALPYAQVLVMEGELEKIIGLFTSNKLHETTETGSGDFVTTLVETEFTLLIERTQIFLKEQLSTLLQLPAHEIDVKAPLEQYGIDSVMVMKLTHQLEQVFGSLSKTLFFEYQTIRALAGYFIKQFPAVIKSKLDIAESPATATIKLPASLNAEQFMRRKAPRFSSGSRTLSQQDVAIVGISGRYPLAKDLNEFWENLKAGRDCITEIPANRWDHQKYFDSTKGTPGKSYSKWGGFVSDIEMFDPLFFNISPREAELMDPQERLFLETAWQVIEDAGYSKETIAEICVGVYVGVMWGHYELYGANVSMNGAAAVVPGSSYASIANRISYFFNFNGPSIALDTMCSSSLTAIHLASEAILRGEVDAAIAGGVNIAVHPQKYISLSQGNFASSDGRCRSFGEGGDGYVPGEGVGAVLLKRLDKAIADGDQIYGIIKASSVNHGGKTNGYTVPNPNAQADVILKTLQKANIDPRTLNYIETHGTGTSLGDPIEITGLVKAFDQFAEAIPAIDKQFCPIGSVKSNIGHLESAAGIAAITKSLLQIKHNQLVPSLHADPLNPNIDFSTTPFYVQTTLKEWPSTDKPRRIGVSSFGAGGANAHVILEEYIAPYSVETSNNAPQLFIFSARNKRGLERYVERFIAYLNENPVDSIANIAYTLRVGRTAMSERLALLAETAEELLTKLSQWRTLASADEKNKTHEATLNQQSIFSGNKDGRYGTSFLMDGVAGDQFIQQLLHRKEWIKLARLWTSGVDIQWQSIHADQRYQRISLPTYPFNRERCWINTESAVDNKNTLAPVFNQQAQLAYAQREICFSARWKEMPLVIKSVGDMPTGPLLIIDKDEALLHAIKTQKQVENSQIVWVKPAKEYCRIDEQTFELDVDKEDHFEQLINQLAQSGKIPVQVLHRHSTTTEPADKQAREAFYTQFNFCKSLLLSKKASAVKLLSVIDGNAEEHAAISSAITAFYKTLMQEQPKYVGQVIYHVGTHPTYDELASQLLNEFKSIWEQVQEVQYKYNTSGSVLRSIKSPELLDVAGVDSLELPIREGGVYVITGGLGGVGYLIGQYLAKNCKAKLVLIGRSSLTEELQIKFDTLKAINGNVIYLSVDVSDADEVNNVINVTKKTFGNIHGVIHSAGANDDAYIIKKTSVQIDSVFSAKIAGTVNLHQATRAEKLDLFIMFSSVASITGNAGQSDYAFANGFLDGFAETRNQWAAKGMCFGRAVSINWPYWKDGGMNISAANVQAIEARTGMLPLSSEKGLHFFEYFLKRNIAQGIAVYGIPEKIISYITGEKNHRATEITAESVRVPAGLPREKAIEYIKTLLGQTLKLAPERIDIFERLESYGMDSVMISQITANIEKDFGDISKTLFYEYETVDDLATYFSTEFTDVLNRMSDLSSAVQQAHCYNVGVTSKSVEVFPINTVQAAAEPIAIIGIHGSFPQASDLNEFWENLKSGTDSIELVPGSRWNYADYYDPDPEKSAAGKIYCKWGGFLNDFDKFDPEFFNIRPEEAKLMDPQERLFLQSVWTALEDAGYTRDSLKQHYPKGKSANVGVFAGVTTNSYHLLADKEWQRGNTVSPSAMPWSIANRVSYFFDFQGPSIPVDTACSSSSVAVHMACESLRTNQCRLAIAGGVNLYLHPSKYHSLCQRQMVSKTGKNCSFGEGDDGFVPGEGVGSLVLKPLSEAVKDGDRIYGVIRSSAFEHSGRSNGYSAPNPNSQASLVAKVLSQANIPAESISYVEGHGTGTQLGDSLEVAALTNAFGTVGDQKQFCALGSVKANIGHSESAAGIAGIVKVLLQLKHQQLVPSIHSNNKNPNIQFEKTPFYLQHSVTPWSVGEYPRRALVNSFGAGGVNACIVLEEFIEKTNNNLVELGANVLVLSARNETCLRKYTETLLNYIHNNSALTLDTICYTLQTAREPMSNRIALVATSINDLASQLRNWLEGIEQSNIFHGEARGQRKSNDIADKSSLLVCLEQRNFLQLAGMWVCGEVIDWALLYQGNLPNRIALPTYPFSKQRHWVSDTPVSMKSSVPELLQLHPLITCNNSTLKEIKYTSILSDDEYFSRDHLVGGQRILPGSVFLEIAYMSATLAGERKVQKITDIIWSHPLLFNGYANNVTTYLKTLGSATEYEIISINDNQERVVHSEGRVLFQENKSFIKEQYKRFSVDDIIRQCNNYNEGSYFYQTFNKFGFEYKSAFQTVKEFHFNEHIAVAKLELPGVLLKDFDRYALHPSLLDGALQTVAALLGQKNENVMYLPFAIDEIEIVRAMPPCCYVYVESIINKNDYRKDIKKFNIRLLNLQGMDIVVIKNFYVRPYVATHVKENTVV